MKYIFFILLFMMPFILPAQDEKYDAVYQNLVKEYTLHPDGSVTYRYIRELKLQSYRAFHNLYGETFVVYDTIQQKLKINEVHTVMSDGRTVKAPENAFNPVLPGFAANAPSLNHLREMVITHTGLERNAVIYLDYEIVTKSGYYPFLSGNELLAEYEPVKNLEIRVRLPKGMTLHYQLYHLDLKPQRSTDQAYDIWSWKLNNAGAIPPEENQQAGFSAWPRLIFSSSGDLPAAYQWLASRPPFDYMLSARINDEMTTMKGKYLDKFELALKIQEKVVNEMRTFEAPLRFDLYQGRTPDQVWKSNGGTTIEKAGLMTAMFRAAGLDAQPAAVVRTDFSDAKTATLSNIEEFVVRVNFHDEGAWYFSVSQLNSVNMKLTLPGRSFIVFDREGKPEITEAEKAKSTVRVNGNFLISSDPKLTGEVSIYTGGSIYPQAAMVRDRKTLKNMLSGNLIRNDSTALKKSILNNENGFQTYTVQSDRPFRADTQFFHLRLPAVTAGVDAWNIRTLSERRESIYEIPSQADESYNFTWALPSGIQLFSPAGKTVVDNKAGTFTRELTQEKGKVTLTRSIRFSKRIFSPSEYPDFKALMDAWNNPWNKVVVFRAE